MAYPIGIRHLEKYFVNQVAHTDTQKHTHTHTRHQAHVISLAIKEKDCSVVEKQATILKLRRIKGK